MKLYCTAENTFDVGSEGKDFNFNLCNFENEDDMRVSHSNGVILYCNSDNAYKRGLEGEVFNNICPKKLSNAYRAEFIRGRKKFLIKQIKIAHRETEDIDHQKANLRLKQNRILKQLNSNVGEQPKLRKELSSNIDNVETQIKNLSLKKVNLQKKIRDYEVLVIQANKNQL